MLLVILEKDRVYIVNIICESKAETETDGIQNDKTKIGECLRKVQYKRQVNDKSMTNVYVKVQHKRQVKDKCLRKSTIQKTSQRQMPA